MNKVDEVILKNILYRTGSQGLTVDFPVFEIEERKFQVAFEIAQVRLNRAAGRAVIVHSPDDVGKLLYEERGNPAVHAKKSGRYSTSLDVLQNCQDSIIPILKEAKTLHANLKYFKIAKKYMKQDGVRYYIPFQYEIEACMTGRIYAKEPSVMSFPESVRKCIIPNPGNEFVHIDFDREELCLMALYSGDKQFLEDVKNGIDIFQELANFFDSTAREKVKIILYAYFYGSTVDSLVKKLMLSHEVVTSALNAVSLRYPLLYGAPAKLISFVKQYGYSETLLEHRKYELNKSNPDVEEEIRRAVNFCPQGTAAEVLRKAILRVDSAGFDFKVSTHDSVLLEVLSGLPTVSAVDSLGQAVMSIDDHLRAILTQDFPQALFVKIGHGKNWFEASGGVVEGDEELDA